MKVVQGAGRPTRGYRLADNTRVPSVTTICSRFKDSGALLRWANNEGLDGRQLYEKRDAAAEAGSICHGWIEDHIHGRDFIDPFAESQFREDSDIIEQALVGFRAFKDWADQVHLTVLETETPLVSETYRFGGTPDARALVAGKVKLLDWKTSSGVWPEYIVQLAAYRELFRERDASSAPESAQLLRVGKEHSDFHLHSYPSSVLDIGWDYFMYARKMYDLDRELKKVAA